MHMYYKLVDKTPVPVDEVEWSNSFVNGNRQVAKDEIRSPKVTVSTVFLGINHSFGMSHEPLLFETMVFGGQLDGEQKRYATYEEAVKGHEEMFRKVMHWWF